MALILAVGISAIIFLTCMLTAVCCLLYDLYGGMKFDNIVQKIEKLSFVGFIAFAIILGILGIASIVLLLVFQ